MTKQICIYNMRHKYHWPTMQTVLDRALSVRTSRPRTSDKVRKLCCKREIPSNESLLKAIQTLKTQNVDILSTTEKIWSFQLAHSDIRKSNNLNRTECVAYLLIATKIHQKQWRIRSQRLRHCRTIDKFPWNWDPVEKVKPAQTHFSSGTFLLSQSTNPFHLYSVIINNVID